MARLHTQVGASTERFQGNAAAMQRLVAELREKTAKAALGGPESSRQRHAGRGKLLPRQRVEQLVDPASPFLELSPLAADRLNGVTVHRDVRGWDKPSDHVPVEGVFAF